MYSEYTLSVVNLFVSCTLQVLLPDEEPSAYFFQHSFSLRQKMLETCTNFFVGEAYLGPGETSLKIANIWKLLNIFARKLHQRFLLKPSSSDSPKIFSGNFAIFHRGVTVQKMKFSMKDFFSKCDQIRSSLIFNGKLHFCAVRI